MRHLTTTVAFLVVIASCGCVSTVSREALIQKASRYDLTSWPDVKRTTTLELNLWMIQESIRHRGTVAAEVTRQICFFLRRNPPPYVGGYDSRTPPVR